MKVAPGCIVKIDYELKTKDGEVIESSAKSGLLTYQHGEGRLLPALEKRLEGLEPGQEVAGEIPSIEVVGPEEALPTREIPKSGLPAGEPIEVGTLFSARAAGAGVIQLKVIKVGDTTVTARLLPPLAGKDLEYRVKVLLIEDPARHKIEVSSRRPPPPPPAALKHKADPPKDS